MTEPTPDPARPEPVVDYAKVAAAVVGVVQAGGAGLVLVGWVTADQVKAWAIVSGGLVMAVGTLLAVVLPIFAAHAARAQVTPLADPKAVDGTPLAPASQMEG